MRRWIAGMLVLAACTRAGADKANKGGDQAPPAILSLIAATEIDSAVMNVRAEERQVASESRELGPSHLTLWQLDGKPAKLVAIVPTDSPKLKLQSTWYFRDGEVVYARTPVGQYTFVDGRLVEAADPSGVVDDMDPASLPAREAELKAEAQGWLKEFKD